MKYESDILKTIHEQALTEFKLGLISEEDMREYDEACLPEKVFKKRYEHENLNIRHAKLVTA